MSHLSFESKHCGSKILVCQNILFQLIKPNTILNIEVVDQSASFYFVFTIIWVFLEDAYKQPILNFRYGKTLFSRFKRVLERPAAWHLTVVQCEMKLTLYHSLLLLYINIYEQF